MLQTQITAMAAAGDAAQEKGVPYSPLILSDNPSDKMKFLFQGGAVSEGSPFEASDT